MNLGVLLRDQNPQWTEKNYQPKEINWFHRQVYYQEILKWLPKNLVISLTGLRRVGKSVLLKQVIGQLLKKTLPEDIFYFSFDQSVVKNEAETLREILNLYVRLIRQQPLGKIKKKLFIFLDEIQIIPYWQDVIKTYYDLNPNLKFIISGSSSLFISRKTTESLAGRLKEISIFPLSFSEYLELNKKTKREIENLGLEKYGRLFPDFLETFFEKYLLFGQFPQSVKENYLENETKEYLSSIENKIIEVDLPKTFPIKRTDILKIIFSYLKENSGSLVQYENLTNDLGVNIRTTVKYIDWLKKTFLIDFCLNQTKKLTKSARTAKKIYLASTNFSENLPIGQKVETYIFNFLKSLNLKIEFFRFQNQEIDFIVNTKKGKKIPFEVKYEEITREADEKTMRAFIDRHQSPYAFMVTKNFEGKPKKIGKALLYYIKAAKIELSKETILRKLK